MKTTRVKIRPDCEIIINTPDDITVEEVWKIQNAIHETYRANRKPMKNSRRLYGDVG